MSSCKCKTINLANISVETLRNRASKLQKIPRAVERSSLESCFPEFIPPPPRKIKQAKIQICRPIPLEYVSPPVPCICPPCPICPSRSEQLKNFIKIATKLGMAYFLFDLTMKKQIWGNPDGTSQIMTDLSNSIAKFTSIGGAKGHDVFGGDRLSLLELDRIKYRLALWWDKGVVFFFNWTIGFPLRFAHEMFMKIEDAAAGDDEDDDTKGSQEPKDTEQDEKKPKKIKHSHNSKKRTTKQL